MFLRLATARFSFSIRREGSDDIIEVTCIYIGAASYEVCPGANPRRNHVDEITRVRTTLRENGSLYLIAN